MRNSFENILIEQRGDGIALLTINRAAQHNALDKATLTELLRAFQMLDEDENTRVVILTGAGDEYFATSDGAFESRLVNGTKEAFYPLVTRIKDACKPVIAAINGLAAGDGHELALTCPLRMGRADALLDYSEQGYIRLMSLVPGSDLDSPWPITTSESNDPYRSAPFIATQRLKVLSLFREIAWNYDSDRYQPLTAQQALTIGLILDVADTREALLEKSLDLAHRIIPNAPLAIRSALAMVTRGMEMNFDDALYLESSLFSLCFATEDAKEGTRAFLEKRAPKFTGR